MSEKLRIVLETLILDYGLSEEVLDVLDDLGYTPEELGLEDLI